MLLASVLSVLSPFFPISCDVAMSTMAWFRATPSPTPMFVPVSPITSHPIPKLRALAEGRNPKSKHPTLRPGVVVSWHRIYLWPLATEISGQQSCPELSNRRPSPTISLHLWHRHSAVACTSCATATPWLLGTLLPTRLLKPLSVVDRRRPRLRCLLHTWHRHSACATLSSNSGPKVRQTKYETILPEECSRATRKSVTSADELAFNGAPEHWARKRAFAVEVSQRAVCRVLPGKASTSPAKACIDDSRPIRQTPHRRQCVE